MPEKAFERLVKRQIQKLEEPAVQSRSRKAEDSEEDGGLGSANVSVHKTLDRPNYEFKKFLAVCHALTTQCRNGQTHEQT